MEITVNLNIHHHGGPPVAEDVLPFAAVAGGEPPADLPPGVDPESVKGIDPATLALLLALGAEALKLFLKWLEKRRAKKAT